MIKTDLPLRVVFLSQWTRALPHKLTTSFRRANSFAQKFFCSLPETLLSSTTARRAVIVSETMSLERHSSLRQMMFVQMLQLRISPNRRPYRASPWSAWLVLYRNSEEDARVLTDDRVASGAFPYKPDGDAFSHCYILEASVLWMKCAQRRSDEPGDCLRVTSFPN